MAENEAKAILTEGLRRAEGIKQLSDAYREGGLALAREAVSKKLAGTVINGRPDSLESRVDRLRIEGDATRAEGAAAARKLQKEEE